MNNVPKPLPGYGARFVEPKAVGPSRSWWAEAKDDREFEAAYQRELPRITAIKGTYRYAHDEGI